MIANVSSGAAVGSGEILGGQWSESALDNAEPEKVGAKYIANSLRHYLMFATGGCGFYAEETAENKQESKEDWRLRSEEVRRRAMDNQAAMDSAYELVMRRKSQGGLHWTEREEFSIAEAARGRGPMANVRGGNSGWEERESNAMIPGLGGDSGGDAPAFNSSLLRLNGAALKVTGTGVVLKMVDVNITKNFGDIMLFMGNYTSVEFQSCKLKENRLHRAALFAGLGYGIELTVRFFFSQWGKEKRQAESEWRA